MNPASIVTIIKDARKEPLASGTELALALASEFAGENIDAEQWIRGDWRAKTSSGLSTRYQRGLQQLLEWLAREPDLNDNRVSYLAAVFSWYADIWETLQRLVEGHEWQIYIIEKIGQYSESPPEDLISSWDSDKIRALKRRFCEWHATLVEAPDKLLETDRWRPPSEALRELSYPYRLKDDAEQQDWQHYLRWCRHSCGSSALFQLGEVKPQYGWTMFLYICAGTSDQPCGGLYSDSSDDDNSWFVFQKAL